MPQPFFLSVNPESYSKNMRIELEQSNPPGNHGTSPRFTNAQPEELRLEFIFDGTETIENYKYNDPDDKSVKRQLELFFAVTYHMESETHRPNFLKLFWGKYLQFQCVISSIDVNFQLFEPNGDPVRAKVSATFAKYVAPKERSAKAKLSSPDLTHFRQAKAGDRLDLMTNRIYKDPKYVLQIAKANNLTTIRSLTAGQDLRFPPLDKTETT